MSQNKQIGIGMALLVIFGGIFAFWWFSKDSEAQVEPETETQAEVVLSGEEGLDNPTVFSMNDLLGFPEGGNTLKMHDTCYDESLDQVYAMGILSPDLAVIKDDEVVDYIDTGLGEGSFSIKHVVCGDGLVLVADDQKVVIMDGEDRKVKKVVEPGGLQYSSLQFDAEGDWFGFMGSPNGTKDKSSAKFQFYSLSSYKALPYSSTVAMPRVFPAEDGQILIVNAQPTQKGGAYVAEFVDSEDFSTVKTLQLQGEVGRVSHLDYDPASDRLWLLGEKGDLLMYDSTKGGQPLKKAKSSLTDLKGVEGGGRYVVVLSENGFQTEDTGNFMGGIEVFDATTLTARYVAEFPHHHTSMSFGKNSEALYITNNSDNSISRIRLSDGKLLATIKAGSGAESGVVDSEGRVYVRNRLGGNQIFILDPSTGDFSVVDSGAWSVGLGYSPTLDAVVSYDFLAGELSLLDAEEGAFAETYELSLADGTTDAIGDMAYDATNDLAYAALPEAGQVAVVDAAAGKTLSTVQVNSLASLKSDEMGGPAILVVAAQESSKRLFVYSQIENRIKVYDGSKNYRLLDEIEVEKRAYDYPFPYSLVVDEEGGRLFWGDQVYDLESFESEGKLKEGQVVAALDAERDLMVTVGVEGEDEEETLYQLNFEGTKVLESAEGSSNQYVQPRFTYDKERSILYSFYMVSSEVWAFEL